MKTASPFTYLIGWSHLAKFYYGVRYAAGCSPTDLWTTYFTSSKFVKTFRELHGEPDVILIRQIFTESQAAKNWELKVLSRMHVATNEKFLNRREAPAFPCFKGSANGMFGRTHSPEALAKMSLTKTGKKWSNSQFDKNKERYLNGPGTFYGKHHSEETKRKLADLGRITSTGEKNGSAKTFKFTDSFGNVSVIKGAFSGFCAKHDLSRTKMLNFLGKGAISEFKGNNKTTQQTKNCVGWSVELVTRL